jgi:hypothetical protein
LTWAHAPGVNVGFEYGLTGDYGQITQLVEMKTAGVFNVKIDGPYSRLPPIISVLLLAVSITVQGLAMILLLLYRKILR